MKYIKKTFCFIYFSFVFFLTACAQPLSQKSKLSRQDTLRGSITPERAWWNVLTYFIRITPDYNTKTIKGSNEIAFSVLNGGKKKKMQIDLQQPLVIDSIFFNSKKLEQFTRNGNVFIIDFGPTDFPVTKKKDKESIPPLLQHIEIYYHGKPREAKTPPWDGGWIWSKDAKGRPWMTVTCQGLGASVWYPCKDYQGDEPDDGATLQINVPDTLVAVGNGRLVSKQEGPGNTVSYKWVVKSPINNYNIVPYIGKYLHWSDNFIGETGQDLTLDYWVLDYNLDKSKKQFDRDVKRMLKAFEHWFGPYPFYEDGFKLVESSHLGMEHQSATAYGNHYMDGYLGRDLSGTGWGLKWDYIIVHESGHEWFANNITTNDIADMWVHEGFTMYSEALFIEYYYGKEAADEYVQGIRNTINNDKPVIGPYGVNQEGSGDMYNKGANMLHTIRQVINDDSLFRQILRGLNNVFFHQTIDSKDIEKYMTEKSGKDLSKIFDQYLRTTKIPVLEYKIQNRSLMYRWGNCIAGFNMPVNTNIGWLYPSTKWQDKKITDGLMENVEADPNFYITVKKMH